MAKRFLTPIGILNLASDPATGSEGEIYYNSTDDILKIYVSGSWTPIEGGGGAAINVSASAPVAPEEGDAWFDNTDGKFYVYDGSFWVETGQTDAVFSSYNRWTKLISASTVNITGLDDSSTNLEFTPGLEQVYINGVFIDESSYTASSGSAIVLDEAVFSTDLVEVLWLENLVVAGTYSKEESDAKYLPLTTASSTYLTIANASATYATQADLDNINLTSTINTASAAAVNFLVDGAPEALNTLNELAAALEDNADILDLYLTQSSASSTYALITSGTLNTPTVNTPSITNGTIVDSIVRGLEENVNIVSASASGTVNLNIADASILYYTANASANHTLNIRYDASNTLNSKLAVGDAITVTWINTNGATPYYPTAYQVDGSSVTPLWQGGSAPTGGNASSTDIYTLTIIKTAATPTYVVLASQTQFKA
jgi:hypothetical protein